MNADEDGERHGSNGLDWGSTGRGGSGAFEIVDEFRQLEFTANDRYTDLDLIGVGGMGRVHRATDTRLGREVALKFVRAPDAVGEARLAHEAMITARLDHPGVVPVHDVGRAANGEAFFAMRLVRGRTMAELITSGAGAGDEPLGELLRHFLDACETIAFAHSRGVIHLDLKPSNVMVGAFGETQVADWGLAREVPVRGIGRPHPGTRAYMSPEQARGDDVDERADVYSLGAILHEILFGRPPSPGRRSAVQRPRELVAICDRALAPDADERYPDATALAADLLRWFDGQLVFAYDYRRVDLLRRAWRAWRTPILLGAGTLLTIAVIAGVAFDRTRTERDAARRAEQQALSARADAQENLADALVSRARDRLFVHDRAAAEVLAANAIGLRDTPAARAILGAFGASPRPTLVSRDDVPEDCERVTPSIDGSTWLCIRQGTAHAHDARLAPPPVSDMAAAVLDDRSLWWVDTAGSLWSWTGEGDPIQRAGALSGVGRFITRPGSPWILNELATRVTIIDRATGSVTAVAPCSRRNLRVSTLATERRVIALCLDGSITMTRIVDGVNETTIIGRLRGAANAAFTLAVSDDFEHLAVGTTEGRAYVQRWDGTLVVEIPGLGATSIDALRFSRGSDMLAVVDGTGRAGIVSLRSGGWLSHLPIGPYEDARWRDNGELALYGRRVDRWRLAPSARPVRFAADAGVAAVAVDGEGRWASAHGDGTVELRQTSDGRRVARWRPQQAVAKDLSFEPDGRRLVVSNMSEPRVVVLDPEQESLVQLDSPALRRVNWLHGGILGFPFTGGPTWHAALSDGSFGPPRVLGKLAVFDAAATPDRRGVVFTSRGGEVWRVSPPAAPVALASLPNANAVVALTDGTVLVSTGPIVHRIVDGRAQRLGSVDATVYDLAVSPDGAHIAIATRGGRVHVWTVAGQPTLVLDGHTSRVASVGFLDADTLVSGSWDASARLWSTRPFVESAVTIERAWGLDLDGAFETRAR